MSEIGAFAYVKKILLKKKKSNIKKLFYKGNLIKKTLLHPLPPKALNGPELLVLTAVRSLLGIQTSQDARFYALSARFDPFSNEGKPLVVQFTVKHEQKIDCGGGYVKIFPSDLDQSDMHGDSQYYIMFGESYLSCRSTES